MHSISSSINQHLSSRCLASCSMALLTPSRRSMCPVRRSFSPSTQMNRFYLVLFASSDRSSLTSFLSYWILRRYSWTMKPSPAMWSCSITDLNAWFSIRSQLICRFSVRIMPSFQPSLRAGLICTSRILLAYCRVEIVQSWYKADGDAQATISDRESPPRLSMSSMVSLESRQGMYPFRSASCRITLARANRDLLICPVSLIMSPSPFRYFTRSLPARSAKVSFPNLRTLRAPSEIQHLVQIISMECARLLSLFRAYTELRRLWFPSLNRPYRSSRFLQSNTLRFSTQNPPFELQRQCRSVDSGCSRSLICSLQIQRQETRTEKVVYLDTRLKRELAAREMSPGSFSSPLRVYVFPEPVCPYAIIVLEQPSRVELTMFSTFSFLNTSSCESFFQSTQSNQKVLLPQKLILLVSS